MVIKPQSKFMKIQGLKPEIVKTTDEPHPRTRPGLIGGIFDGIQRPLDELNKIEEII